MSIQAEQDAEIAALYRESAAKVLGFLIRLGCDRGLARPGQQHHRQLRDRQAELVKLPAGAGEEVVRPVMRPGVLQGTAQQHANHGPAADLARQPGDQPAERREPRRGETRPQLAQQARQRSG